MTPLRLLAWSALADRSPTYALVADVDLVVVRVDDTPHVFYGRCLHRGALLSDGFVRGENLICGVHDWDYRVDSGVSEYNNAEVLPKFVSWVEDGGVLVDEDEIAAWALEHPQPYNRKRYLGLYADPTHEPIAEDKLGYIATLARKGLHRIGHHGPVSAMGVPRGELPHWDSLLLLTAQLATPPLLEDVPVETQLVIGPRARKPLTLEVPVFVSDMSFGSISAEAKVALAKGAEAVGTGVCSGEGGMLPEEQAANSRYLYELASGRFGWRPELVEQVQALHFKGGQGAKTGTGGHLPGAKVVGRIAEVRKLPVGEAAISPPRFPDLVNPVDFQRVADEIRERSGGIPIGFKISAQHIEDDIDFALQATAEYIILDGRGGATGAAPDLFKQNISVPTLPALARARRHLDRVGAGDVTLIITGGLRTESDFVKAMALGADGVAVSNAALQAIGCLGMRACHTNNCPVGIATQREDLRLRLEIAKSAKRLQNWFEATVHLMEVLARACGHDALSGFTLRDLTTIDRELAHLSGVRYAGVLSP